MWTIETTFISGLSLGIEFFTEDEIPLEEDKVLLLAIMIDLLVFRIILFKYA